ncbi:MAG: isochorismatase family protein [Muribaculaceae bacterium]|nr:isochorismatase family protein [Muribaculaceae bacterium]
MNRMLLIIDPQNDFINGSLPINGAEEAMNNLAGYISRNSGKYALKIVTADRHPFYHCSFTDCGGEWPRHCVHDTVGAAIWQPLFRPLYETSGAVRFLYKGESADRDEYSIFKNPEAARIIRGLVENEKIEQIDICGLAGDVCVRQSLLDGIELFGPDKFNLLTPYSPTIN